jgi:hypothetical protein
MSIHVYLKNEVVKASQFRTKGQADSSKPGGVFLTGSAMSEINLSINKTGRLHFQIDGGDIIPPVLEQYIDEISIWGTIPSIPHREFGVYKTESARAEVEIYTLTNESIKVTSKVLAGALALVEKIKAGTIRPNKSYEAPQGGKSRRQLEAELTGTEQQLGEAWAEIEGLRATCSELITECYSASDLTRKLETELATTQETAELLGSNLSATQKQLGEISSRNTHWGLKLAAIQEFATELTTTRPDQFGLKWRTFCLRSKVAKRLNTILNAKS